PAQCARDVRHCRSRDCARHSVGLCRGLVRQMARTSPSTSTTSKRHHAHGTTTSWKSQRRRGDGASSRARMSDYQNLSTHCWEKSRSEQPPHLLLPAVLARSESMKTATICCCVHCGGATSNSGDLYLSVRRDRARLDDVVNTITWNRRCGMVEGRRG